MWLAITSAPGLIRTCTKMAQVQSSTPLSAQKAACLPDTTPLHTYDSAYIIRAWRS
jgi:hypothetical protein